MIKHIPFCSRFIYAFLLFALSYVSSFSQKMSISSFQLVENDLTANTHGTIVHDQNGEKCALIKVETTQRGFTFDAGMLGVIKTEEKPGEVWVYVPEKVKRLTISHPRLGVILRDHDLGQSVKKGRTYLLKLTTDQVNTSVVDYNNSQNLILDVFPHNADVYLNGIPFKLDESGRLETPLTFGTHTYRIAAPNYHSTEGQVVIEDKEHKQNLRIKLKQAFGYVSIKSPSDEFKGADIYIDSVYIGIMPLVNFQLKSGLHNVIIKKKLYNPYSETFAVTDSSFVNIKPIFEPNYAEVVISTENEAQIFDNGELIGVGTWQGRLEAGGHVIEVKKIAHRTVAKKIELTNGEERKISIEAPIPIYGSLEISSFPSGADVYMDGSKIGTTPFIKSKVLIGEHNVEIKKDGYKTEIETIKIEEDKTLRINKELVDFCNAQIRTNVPAEIFINGKKKGNTPYQLNLEAGTYMVELKSKGYSNYSKKMDFNGSTDDMLINIKRNHVRENEFYLQCGYNPQKANFWNVGFGFYIKNVGLEFNYFNNINTKETIYWTDGEAYPIRATYAPLGYNIKFGYAFRLNSHLRVTPQVGMQWMRFVESASENNYNSLYSIQSYFIEDSYVTSISVGGRVSCAITNRIGISITPEYTLPIKESRGYRILSETSPLLRDLPKGFSSCINLNLFF